MPKLVWRVIATTAIFFLTLLCFIPGRVPVFTDMPSRQLDTPQENQLDTPQENQLDTPTLSSELMPKPRPSSGPIPKIIHTVWMANPLNPYFLSSLDSVLQFMPDVTFKLHILTPSGANSTVLSAIYSQFEAQLKPFLDVPGFDLRILLHDDIPSELIGTPLEGKGITQEHMGGTVEGLLKLPTKGGDRKMTPHGDNFHAMVHASDFYRLLTLYREGGLWMDTDHIMLQDIWPLLDKMGSFVLCEYSLDAESDGTCALLNGFFAVTPRHPFLWDGLHRVASLIESHKVNALFPIRERVPFEPREVKWTAVGPHLFSFVRKKWLEKSSDLWVVPSSNLNWAIVQDVRQRPDGVVSPNTTSIDTSMTILGRRYFIPTCWSQRTQDKLMNARYAEMYSRAFSFHLWEYKRRKKKLRNNFVQIVRDQPCTVLAHLFRRTCLIICDPDDLTRQPPTIDELMSAHSALNTTSAPSTWPDPAEESEIEW